MDLDIKQKKIPINIVIMLIGSIVLVVAYFSFTNGKEIDANSLTIAKVKKGSIVFSLIASGVLEPKVHRRISSQSSGVVTDIQYEVGNQVKQSDVLVRLKNPKLFTELQSAQSTLKILKSELISEKYRLKNMALDIESDLLDLNAELKLAQEKLIAENQLADRGIYSKLDLSRSKSKVQQLKGRLEIAQKRYEYFNATLDAQLETKKAKIADLEYRLTLKQSQFDNLAIKSNLDGVLQEINIEIGKNVIEGEEVALVVQDYPLIAKIQVNQGAINKVKLGAAVTINASNQQFIGHVYQIAPQVIDGTVEVVVQLPDDYPRSLKAQLNVSATIKLSNFDNVLWLPRPDRVTKGNNEFYKISNDGKSAEKTKVLVGEISNTQIEIISGLNQGDKVIVDALQTLDDKISLR